MNKKNIVVAHSLYTVHDMRAPLHTHTNTHTLCLSTVNQLWYVVLDDFRDALDPSVSILELHAFFDGGHEYDVVMFERLV